MDHLWLQMGFFAEAGPLQVFVSNHLIPEDFEFNTAHEPCYINGDGEQKIVPGSEVRLRIVGTRVDAHEIVSHGWLVALWVHDSRLVVGCSHTTSPVVNKGNTA
mgnify:CR=1 FL=1